MTCIIIRIIRQLNFLAEKCVDIIVQMVAFTGIHTTEIQMVDNIVATMVTIIIPEKDKVAFHTEGSVSSKTKYTVPFKTFL